MILWQLWQNCKYSPGWILNPTLSTCVLCTTACNENALESVPWQICREKGSVFSYLEYFSDCCNYDKAELIPGFRQTLPSIYNYSWEYFYVHEQGPKLSPVLECATSSFLLAINNPGSQLWAHRVEMGPKIPRWCPWMNSFPAIQTSSRLKPL